MTTPAPDTSNSPVCRTAGGALDNACYERHARRLRAQFLRESLSRLLLLLDTAWRRVKLYATRRARLRELSALDDHALKDLALDRSDLPAITSGAFFHDATRRQRRATQTKKHASDIALPVGFD